MKRTPCRREDADEVVARLLETHPGRLFSRIKPYGSLVLYSDELTDFANDLAHVAVSGGFEVHMFLSTAW